MKVRTIYTQTWVRYLISLLLRDVARSLAFGLLMLLGIIFLLGSPLLISSLCSSPSNNFDHPSDHAAWIGKSSYSNPLHISKSMLGLFFLGMPLAVMCWWGALEVADDRHWENTLGDVWENRHAHSIANTIEFANQLRARGMEVDTSLLLAEDIYSQAHQFIESTDENTLRLYMAAILATAKKQTQYQHQYKRQHQHQHQYNSGPQYLPKLPILHLCPIDVKTEDEQQ
ncbi:MAG: hypothetical protein K9M75_06350 [Phycisphaerae bacterium]|nr:hypothetical protein [Phycisphaerae bacterium]